MSNTTGFAQFMKNNQTPRSVRYNQSAAPQAETPVVAPPNDSRFADHAKNILTPAPIDQDLKASVWEVFHTAKSSAELADKLNSFPLPDDLKQRLVAAKKINDPIPSNVDKVVDAIKHVATIDPKLLDLAEKHKTVFKFMTDAALQTPPVSKQSAPAPAPAVSNSKFDHVFNSETGKIEPLGNK